LSLRGWPPLCGAKGDGQHPIYLSQFQAVEMDGLVRY